jgi:hypothetical protein
MKGEGAAQEQYTRREVVYFFCLLRREGEAENWNRGCYDALAVLLEFRDRNVL